MPEAPALLSDLGFAIPAPGIAYQLTAGEAELLVDIRHPGGGHERVHLATLSRGAVLTGARLPEAPGLQLQVRVRGRVGARIVHCDAPPVEAIEAWIHMVSSVLQPGPPPGEVQPLSTGAAHLSVGAHGAAAVRWVRWDPLLCLSGESLGDWGPVQLLPLAPPAWIVVREPISTVVFETAQVRERGWQDGASVLLGMAAHRAAQARARERRAAARHRRLRAEFEASASREGLARLAGVGTPRAARRADAAPETTAVVHVCRQVCHLLALPEPDVPAGVLELPPSAQLEALLRSNHLRSRPVRLRGEWWRQDVGPLLGWTADDSAPRPVVLRPRARGGYAVVDVVSGTTATMTAAMSEALAPHAVQIYRPLPGRPLANADLLRFAGWRLGGDLGQALFLGAAAGAAGMVLPIATGLFFDRVIPEADRVLFWQLAASLLIASVGALLFELSQRLLMLRARARIDAHLQAALWDRVLRLPTSFFRDFTAGDLALRTLGVSAALRRLGAAAPLAVLSGVFAAWNLAVMVSVHPGLALRAVLVIALASPPVALIVVQRLRHEHVLAEQQGAIAGLLLQLLAGLPKLRVAAAERRAFWRWGAAFTAQSEAQHQAQRWHDHQRLLAAGLPLVAIGLLYWWVGSGDMPQLSTGRYLAFATAFAALFSAGLGAASAAHAALDAVPLLDRARPLLEAQPEERTGRRDPGSLTGRISIDRLRFRYAPSSAPVLDGISLDIQPGEFVAFVGSSGSGKSTLLRVLLGFERPEAGEVYYDGHALRSLDRSALRRQLGVVLQDGGLPDGTILSGLQRHTQASAEAINRAISLVGMKEDIRRMPQGLNTRVSHRGGTLSGGQRQRLALARVLLQKPSILLLDEATSALDNRSQARVSASLSSLPATRLVIAHRLSTIRHADRIIVLERGRITQEGRYEDLIRQDGVFRRMAGRQLAEPLPALSAPLGSA